MPLPFLRFLMLAALPVLLAACLDSSSNGSAPSDLTYPGAPFTFAAGTPIEVKVPQVTGAVSAYDVVPPLPQGLVLDRSTGSISGTPTAATLSRDYTVTASNPAGSTETRLQIAVIASWIRLLGFAQQTPIGEGVIGYSVATHAGNVYVAGSSTGDVDGQVASGLVDLLLTKYDGSGNRLWTRLFGVAGAFNFANGVATLPDGDVCAVGYTSTGLAAAKAIVLDYDASGRRKWLAFLGGENEATFAMAVAASSDGHLYVVGDTSGDLGGQSIAGVTDMFLARYDAEGNLEWVRLLGADSATTTGGGVAIDSSGAVYVTGYSNGSLDGQEAPGRFNAFLTKYRADGVRQWTKMLGVEQADTYATSVTTSGKSVYITGNTTGALDAQASTGTNTVLVARFDDSGKKLWTRLASTTGDTTSFGTGIVATPDGNVYATGITDGDLNGQKLNGNHDAFLIKYSPEGSLMRTGLLGADGGFTKGNAIASDVDGNIYYTGYTDTSLGGQTLVGDRDLILVRPAR